MKTLNILLIFGLALTVGLVFGSAVNKVAYNSAAAEVYAACQASRMSATLSEKHCGELQDKYKIEYLCKQNNTLVSNHCWTESNPALGD